MALPWVRMDTQWPQNPKFLDLADDKKWRSIVVYWAALGWSGAQGQAGYVPKSALPMNHATVKEASDLVASRLWVPSQGGWDINGWTEFQPTNEEHERRSQKAREAARARWNKEAL